MTAVTADANCPTARTSIAMMIVNVNNRNSAAGQLVGNLRSTLL